MKSEELGEALAQDYWPCFSFLNRNEDGFVLSSDAGSP